MHSTRTNASKRDDERRREDSPRPAPTTDRPTETSRRAAPRAPLPSPSRKSTSIKTKNGHTIHTITKIMPAPWIEHGILSLRRRAPVETGARTVQSVALFHECAGVGTRLTRYHCAIQASARTRVHRHRSRADRRVSTPSRGGLTGPSASFHGFRRLLWVSMEGLGRVWVGFREEARREGCRHGRSEVVPRTATRETSTVVGGARHARGGRADGRERSGTSGEAWTTNARAR